MASSLLLSNRGPSLTLEGTEGFESVLGVADMETTITGESQRTSAASLTFFGKDKKVIWSATR
jgi:hypothetical protein